MVKNLFYVFVVFGHRLKIAGVIVFVLSSLLNYFTSIASMTLMLSFVILTLGALSDLVSCVLAYKIGKVQYK